MLVMLARLSDYKPTRDFLIKVVLGIIAVSTILFTGIFLFKNLYITLFLSSQYHQIGGLLPYQFTGDVFRLIAAVGSYYFLAKKMLSQYVGLEVLSALIFSIATTYFIIHIGNGAAVFAHLVTYASIFLFVSTLALRAMNNQSKHT